MSNDLQQELLKDCVGFYGDAEVINSEPSILVYNSVLYVPIGDTSSPAGIYDSGRKIVTSTAYFRGPDLERERWTTPYRRCNVVNNAGNEIFIYGGDLHHHFGHFLLSTWSRYWPFVKVGFNRSLRIVVHTLPGAAEFLASHPFAADLFRSIGLREENFVTFREPTVIDKLIVPSASFEETSFAHPAFAELSNCAGYMLARDIPPSPSDRPAYLSKERLTSGVRKVVNEADITNHLAKNGVDIFFPEQLPLSEQAALWRDRRIVAGFVGSALHVGALAPGRSVIGISDSEVLNSSFHLTDLVNGTKAIYLGTTDRDLIEVKPETDAFNSLKSLRDPIVFAESILRSIDRLS